MTKMISVIVPVYNVEKYLDKCVDSILHQEYSDIEIILVDDGSLDNGGLLCDEYACRYQNITVVHKQNGGLSDARNMGIRAADGDWIAFVDSDDYVDQRYLQALYDAVTRDDSDLSVCDFVPIREDRTIIERWGGLPNLTLSNKADMIRIIDSHWKIVPAWNKLYKAKLFDDLEFEKGKLHEDEFFIHRVLVKCNRITIISDALYYYLQRGGSITTTKNIQNQLDAFEALIQRCAFCQENGLPINPKFLSLSYLDKVVTDPCQEDEHYVERYCSLKQQYKKLFFSVKKNRQPLNYLRYYNNKLYYKLFQLLHR